MSINLLACEISTVVWESEMFLSLPFFGIGMKTDLFQSCGHCWVFQMCWHIKYSTLTASSFKIWNSQAGIPSPPLAHSMLPKAHLTSHSRMSDSTLVAGSLRLLLDSSYVYSCHLFLILSASVRSLPFLSFIVLILHEMFSWYLQFSWSFYLYLL